MKQLQKTVFRNFIGIILLLFLAMALTDSLATMFLEPRLRTPLQYLLLAAVRLTLDIVFIVLAALLFWRLTQAAFEKEGRRQKEAENLLYAAIVHDLKTPLTSVKGYAHALADGRVAPGGEAGVLRLIAQKSDQVTRLVDELFRYTRVSAAAPFLKKERTDLVVLVQEVVSDAYDLVEANAVELDLDLPQTPLHAEVAEGEMRRLVANLFHNAIRHNRPGSRIQVRLRAVGQGIELAVADDGESMDRAGREELFQPFVKLDAARSSSGSGLGLAIADAIAQAHGGSLEIVEPYPGYTKAFVLKLEAG
ncbi:MAG: HAMP domain-containing sensor histidine kinase [Bacillota bacterium]|nr:HAMP domain-containing sensor histidine kinase [Bacillota bacterium]